LGGLLLLRPDAAYSAVEFKTLKECDVFIFIVLSASEVFGGLFKRLRDFSVKGWGVTAA
jgi:hypothetical protein